MYETDPQVGARWLAELQHTLPAYARHVLSIRPALRDTEDGGTDLFAIVVVDDGVPALGEAERRDVLRKIDEGLTSVILGDEHRPAEGWPVVTFRTTADDRATAAH